MKNNTLNLDHHSRSFRNFDEILLYISALCHIEAVSEALNLNEFVSAVCSPTQITAETKCYGTAELLNRRSVIVQ